MAAAAAAADEDAVAGCLCPGLSSDDIRDVIGADGGADSALNEKTLVGKGNRQLMEVGKFLVEWGGARKAKFISKDADRFEAMIAAAKRSDLIPLILLKSDGSVCRKNTLPRLDANGIIVQRE